MCSVTEKATSDDRQPHVSQAVRLTNLHLGPRRRKETMLPQITRLALEGHSGQAIAKVVGLPKRTVNHWLRELRREWSANVAQGAAEMMAVSMARLDSIYREAMEAWRDSQTEIQIRLVEDTEAASDDRRSRKKKSSVRTQPPRRNAAMLARAIDVVKATYLLMGPAAPPPAEAGGVPPIPLEMLTTKDMKEMTDDELRNVMARSRAAIAAAGGAVPGLEEIDLSHMTDDELRAIVAETTAELEACEREEELARGTAAQQQSS